MVRWSTTTPGGGRIIDLDPYDAVQFFLPLRLRTTLQDLEVEQQKSERLLLNVLPAPIADRLKRGEETIVDSFEEVSVLFADIVGFTDFASQVSPTYLVNMLNQIFSAFDDMSERHQLVGCVGGDNPSNAGQSPG